MRWGHESESGGLSVGLTKTRVSRGKSRTFLETFKNAGSMRGFQVRPVGTRHVKSRYGEQELNLGEERRGNEEKERRSRRQEEEEGEGERLQNRKRGRRRRRKQR